MADLRLDHVGAVVLDLDEAVRFFVALGLEIEGEAEVGGSWVDRVLGLEGVSSRIVMVRTPDGTGHIELSTFVAPEPAETVAPVLPASAPGFRHVSFEVPDIAATVASAREAGYGTVGEVVDYEDVYRLVYLRGPEGLIVEVAQRL